MFQRHNIVLKGEDQAKVMYFIKLAILIFGCPRDRYITNFTRKPHQLHRPSWTHALIFFLIFFIKLDHSPGHIHDHWFILCLSSPSQLHWNCERYVEPYVGITWELGHCRPQRYILLTWAHNILNASSHILKVFLAGFCNVFFLKGKFMCLQKLTIFSYFRAGSNIYDSRYVQFFGADSVFCLQWVGSRIFYWFTMYYLPKKSCLSIQI